MNNSWNKFIYKLWSPMYDRFFNSGPFLKARKQIFKEIEFEKGQQVLFAGVGTGADLELVDHSSLDITAIDFSPDMLAKAKEKFKGSSISFIEMDAQKMELPDESFDYVIGSLILSVVPDPFQSLNEMERVLKPEGKIVLFDKFAPQDNKLSFSKVLFRPLVKILGTDIGLNFESLIRSFSTSLQVIENKPVMMNGMYRKIVIVKR